MAAPMLCALRQCVATFHSACARAGFSAVSSERTTRRPGDVLHRRLREGVGVQNRRRFLQPPLWTCTFNAITSGTACRLPYLRVRGSGSSSGSRSSQGHFRTHRFRGRLHSTIGLHVGWTRSAAVAPLVAPAAAVAAATAATAVTASAADTRRLRPGRYRTCSKRKRLKRHGRRRRAELRPRTQQRKRHSDSERNSTPSVKRRPGRQRSGACGKVGRRPLLHVSPWRPMPPNTNARPRLVPQLRWQLLASPAPSLPQPLRWPSIYPLSRCRHA